MIKNSMNLYLTLSVFPFLTKRGRYRATWKNRNWTCRDFECIFWKAVMRYALPNMFNIRQIIFNEYFKISLNDVKTSKNTQRLGKISDCF